MTIKDIARESGYAIGTVSRVLNNQPNVSEKARKKIMETVKAHGFVLNNNAKQLRQTSSSDIAILVKGMDNSMFALIVEEIQKQIRKAGYSTSVYYIDEYDNEVIEALKICREIKPPAIMFLGGNAKNFDEKSHYIKIPAVMVTTDVSELGLSNLSSVGINDGDASYSAIEYLINKGHRHIGVIGGNVDDSDTCYRRFYGCMECFDKYGLKFDIARQYEQSRFALDSAYRAAERLLEKMPEVTAIFAMSDTMAIGIMSALHDAGRKVPEDISVIGFDGLPIGQYYRPKLSTVRQPVDSIAKRSVNLIIEGLKNGAVASHEFLPFEMVEGESVRAIS